MRATESGPVTEPASVLSGGTPGGTGQNLADAVKSIGLIMTDDHRYYWNGKGPYPSVTTVLKVLDKPAVTNWIARETARAAFHHPTEGRTEDDYISFLVAQPRERTDIAAKLGSSVHLLADMASRSPQDGPGGFEIPSEALPYLEAFRGFLGRYSASSIISSEKAVLNLSDGYAGTYDLIMQIAGALWLIDIKTSKGYYPEYALQLAGYGHAEWIALPGDPTLYPMPSIQRYGVLHLRPDTYPDTGWRLVEYSVTDRDYLAFLAALDIYQWKGERRFTKSILQKAIVSGELDGIGPDPLTEESR